MTEFNVEGDIVFRAFVIGEFCTADPIAESSLWIPCVKDNLLCQLDPTLLCKSCGHFFVHWHFRVKHAESIKLSPGL
jgi:hypothetical protein